ncbi:MAG: glycosyltransferase family 2 protein [Ilumatobacteraceae bacterium]
MISVVIPTRNRESWLKKCLAAMLAQNITAPFEIIVVNDGSTDGTREFLDSLRDERVRVVHHDARRGKSAARNSGIRTAHGEIIAFTDDDMAVDKSWLTELARMFSTDNVVGVFGATHYVGDAKKHYFPERVVANPHARFPMGGNIAYRRQVFDRVGFFDSHFDSFANEDTEFALRALRVGHLVANSNAIATHAQSTWTAKTLIKSAKNASVWPLLMKRYPHELRNARFHTPMIGRVVYPKDYLALLFSPFLIPIMLLRFFLHGKRNIFLFFVKWPVLLIVRRVMIWREAWREKIFVV